ncbi:hypothetical protein SASPL_118250 [Salvia splendens]|uniref:poly(A)-specific ribonuclease n=1 Tax=Salvia splendens TaxID=180675 RepID=A0A8X8ZYI7_SALSN|nr:hypothetical protein SASPL_118250 [Salvia splendens]
MSVLQRSDSTLIREVYAENLEEEFSVIRGIVEQYPFISMDTEFPGIIYKEWRSTEEGKYSNFRRNVDVLKLCSTWAYDFAFLMKMLIGSYLPDSLDRYQSLLNTYFPVIYDLKFMITLTPYDGGLALNVERLGTAHQAGSDSLLTAGVFVKQGSDRHVCWEGLWWIVAGYQSSYILRFEI